MSFFVYLPRSGIVGSCFSSTFFFFSFRNILTVHSGSANLHYHQQCRRVPFSPHLFQHLWFVNFWLQPFWQRYFIVVLICISLITSDVEHLLMHLLICLSSLDKWLCLLPSFWLGCFGLFVCLFIELYEMFVYVGDNYLSMYHLQIFFLSLYIFLFYLWFPLLCNTF